MPIYEYRRPDGSTFEILQSFSDEALSHDPDTGVEVTRVLHAPAVHFKGKGFYNTDYGTRKRQRETAAAAEASKESSKDVSSAKSAEGGSSSSSSSEGKSKGESKSSSEGSSSSSSPSKSEGSKAKAGSKK